MWIPRPLGGSPAAQLGTSAVLISLPSPVFNMTDCSLVLESLPFLGSVLLYPKPHPTLLLLPLLVLLELLWVGFLLPLNRLLVFSESLASLLLLEFGVGLPSGQTL